MPASLFFVVVKHPWERRARAVVVSKEFPDFSRIWEGLRGPHFLISQITHSFSSMLPYKILPLPFSRMAYSNSMQFRGQQIVTKTMEIIVGSNQPLLLSLFPKLSYVFLFFFIHGVFRF